MAVRVRVPLRARQQMPYQNIPTKGMLLFFSLTKRFFHETIFLFLPFYCHILDDYGSDARGSAP